MAQPANESRKPFCERATSDPPIRWEKWPIQVKLAILNCHVNRNTKLLSRMQPNKQRDRQTPNNQVKLQWEGKCQKITEAGIFCGDRSWTLCDQICVSLLYLNIGSEDRRLLTTKFPHDNIYDLSPMKLWEMLKSPSFGPVISLFIDMSLIQETKKGRNGGPILYCSQGTCRELRF